MSLEQLAIDHAYWAAQVSIARKEGQRAADECKNYKDGQNKNCIEKAWDYFRSAENVDSGGYDEPDLTYDECFDECEPCESCRLVRQKKKERMYARRRLGAIRSAITKMGRNMTPNA